MTNRIVFITGANKGLGFETARRLKDVGYAVYIGARDVARGEAAAKELGVEMVQLDVGNLRSIEQAAIDLQARAGRVDILINNAGISGAQKDVREITGADAAEVFTTNFFGPVHVIHAFLPLLEKSAAAVIVNVSSGLGSFERVHDQNVVESTVFAPLYSASKSALTMLTVQYARALPHMRVNAADPGYTATDMNANSGPQTVTEGTDAIVQLACISPTGPTGTFVDRHGQVGW